MFNTPTFKNNKYVTRTSNAINFFISDVKIKSLFKFSNNKGYLLGIYIPDSVNHDIISELEKIDKDTFQTILKHSNEWFNKSFEEEDLMMLYEPSFCAQSSSICLILSNDSLVNCTFNDKALENIDDLITIFKNNKKLKECLININIQHYGLYFYKDKAVAKWFIKNINITETSYEKCYWMKEDIDDKLADNILTLKTKVVSKINEHKNTIHKLETDMENIQQDFSNIQKEKNWIQAVDRLNKNIMLLEERL